jgi:hypothetical protein
MRLTPERLALLAGGFCLAVALILGFIPAPDAVAHLEGGDVILDCGSVLRTTYGSTCTDHRELLTMWFRVFLGTGLAFVLVGALMVVMERKETVEA